MIEDKKVLRKTDIVFGIILISVSLFFLCQSIKMPRTSDILRAQNNREALLTSPGLFPIAVSSMLIVLGILLIISALREGAKLTKEDFTKFKAWFSQVESKNIMIIFAILIVYTFGFLGRLPYVVSTFIYLSVFMYIFKATNWKMILLISALSTAIIAYLFGTIVMIPLP